MDTAAVGPPEIESVTEKATVLFRRNRERQRASFAVELRERNVLNMFDAQRLEEPIEFFGLLNIGLAEDHERVEFDFAFLQQRNGIHDFAPCAVPRFVIAVKVVHRLGTVERYSEQPVVLEKNIAPFVVEKGCVGLHGIRDAVAGAAMFLLEFAQLAKKIRPGKCGLSALKREDALRIRIK